jgi:hypothetical protein
MLHAMGIILCTSREISGRKHVTKHSASEPVVASEDHSAFHTTVRCHNLDVRDLNYVVKCCVVRLLVEGCLRKLSVIGFDCMLKEKLDLISLPK